MTYFPDENTSDGGAETITQGYFDGDNVPPWDTWVGMFDGGPGHCETTPYSSRGCPPGSSGWCRRGCG